MATPPTTPTSLHLHLLPPRQEGHEILRAAALRADGDTTPLEDIPETDRLWFAIPTALDAEVTDSADPFLVGLIFRAMTLGLPLHVHGRVSPTLLAGLDEFMAIFSAWHPRELHALPITADDEREPDPPTRPDEAIMGFTGGLDSCHTAGRHTTGRIGRRRVGLTAGLFGLGIDLHLEKDRDWSLASAGVRRMLDSVDMQMFTLRTSFHRLAQRPRRAFGAAVLSGLLLFQRRFGTALIASGCDYSRYTTPEPTSPLTDRLLSTGACRVVHDGAECGRPAKAREIADWTEALADLRVCFRYIQDGGNCCRCEKCIRTILDFRVAGLPRPAAFPQDVTDQQIASIRFKTFGAYWGFETLLLEAEATGRGDESWVDAVRRCLAARRRRNALKRFRKGFRRWRARAGLYQPA